MWIKICGITSADAIAAAADARVDAIGFVFAPSPRQVTPGQAAQLAALAPPGILRIAVAQHPLQMKVDEICRILKPDYFQTDVEDLRELKIPAHVKVLPVVRFGRKTPSPLPARMLFEGPSSGIGEVADWGRAAELARQTEVILAGGLSAQNVEEAIQVVRPFGVDVSSGVEAEPGVKDPEKIHQFVRVARANNVLAEKVHRFTRRLLSTANRGDAIGQTMMLDQKPYQVIGVMRSDFAWPRRYELWTPIALPPTAFSPDEFFNENYQASVRLLPGVSPAQFNADV